MKRMGKNDRDTSKRSVPVVFQARFFRSQTDSFTDVFQEGAQLFCVLNRTYRFLVRAEVRPSG